MMLPTEQVEESREEILKNDLPNEKFNLDQVKIVWNNFLNQLKKENNIPAYNALSTTQLNLLNKEIIFEFSSNSSKQEFEQHRNRIRNNMVTNLKNHYFVFQTRFSEIDNENYFLTKKEKFEQLSNKNPVLLKLKEDFGLDLFE